MKRRARSRHTYGETLDFLAAFCREKRAAWTTRARANDNAVPFGAEVRCRRATASHLPRKTIL